jgi:hypothetical protein
MTGRKVMEWFLESIIINLESILRILVNGQWSVVSDHQWYHQVVSSSAIVVIRKHHEA